MPPKRKVIVETGNAKIDSYFKPTIKEKMFRKRKFDENDENASPHSSQHSSSQNSQQLKLSSPHNSQHLKLASPHSSQQTKLSSPHSSQSKQQPLATTTRKFGGENGATSAPKKVDCKSGKGENAGQRTFGGENKNGGGGDDGGLSATRQPLKEKPVQSVQTLKLQGLANAKSNAPSFDVYCDDDIPRKRRMTVFNDENDTELNTQFISTSGINDTQYTQYAEIASSPIPYEALVDKSEFGMDKKIHVYKDGDPEPDLSVLDDDDEDEDKAEEKDNEEEDDDDDDGDFLILADTEPKPSIKLMPVVIDRSTSDNDEEEEDILDRIINEPVPTKTSYKKSFFSDEEEQGGFFSDKDNDDSGSTSGFFDDDKDDDEEFVPLDEFSVGVDTTEPSLTLSPSFTEPVKEYHRPYPEPRGKTFFEKYKMKEPEDDDEEQTENLKV